MYFEKFIFYNFLRVKFCVFYVKIIYRVPLDIREPIRLQIDITRFCICDIIGPQSYALYQ
jgi:hypothetical protein